MLLSVTRKTRFSCKLSQGSCGRIGLVCHLKRANGGTAIDSLGLWKLGSNSKSAIFKLFLTDFYFEHLLWNCFHVNATKFEPIFMPCGITRPPWVNHCGAGLQINEYSVLVFLNSKTYIQMNIILRNIHGNKLPGHILHWDTQRCGLCHTA